MITLVPFFLASVCSLYCEGNCVILSQSRPSKKTYQRACKPHPYLHAYAPIAESTSGYLSRIEKKFLPVFALQSLESIGLKIDKKHVDMFALFWFSNCLWHQNRTKPHVYRRCVCNSPVWCRYSGVARLFQVEYEPRQVKWVSSMVCQTCTFQRKLAVLSVFAEASTLGGTARYGIWLGSPE